MMEPTIYSKGLKLQAGPDARAFQVNGRHCLGILESYNSVIRRSFGEEFIAHHKSMTEVLQADPSLIGAFFPHPVAAQRRKRSDPDNLSLKVNVCFIILLALVALFC
jgi:hypothetical protein